MSDAPELVKIRLPGESPWAEVVSIDHDAKTAKVRIDNRVAGDYTPEEWHKMLDEVFGGGARPWLGKDERPHGYKQDEVITVHLTEYGLEPVESRLPPGQVN